MNEYVEGGIELSDQDKIDLAQLGVTGDGIPQFHPILEVWREVLGNAPKERLSQVTPHWCTKIVSTYAGIGYADCGRVHRGYFDLLEACLACLEWVIAKDPTSLKATTPEDDVASNSENIFNVLMLWQMTFMATELEWDYGSPTAAADLASISECHKILFGDLGITAYLDNIKFQFDDEDQAMLLDVLNDMKEGK